MHYPTEFKSGRGIAAVLLREMADKLGHRERTALQAWDVRVRRWPDSSDCLEFEGDGQTCVIRRDRTVVG